MGFAHARTLSWFLRLPFCLDFYFEAFSLLGLLGPGFGGSPPWPSSDFMSLAPWRACVVHLVLVLGWLRFARVRAGPCAQALLSG